MDWHIIQIMFQDVHYPGHFTMATLLTSSEGNTDNLSNDPAITSSIIIPCTNIKAIKHGLNNRAITLPNKYATTIRDTITSTTIIHLNAGIIILIVMMVNP